MQPQSGCDISESIMKFRFNIFTCTLLTLFCHLPLYADDISEGESADEMSEVFASQGDVFITQSEIDAAFSKIPAEYRLAYIRNGDRVNRIIGDLLRIRIVAEKAKAAHFDEDSLIKSRMVLAAEKELAEAWMAKIKADTPVADYEAMANEYYLSNPEQFMTGEGVDVSHILISSNERSKEEAFELATSLKEQLIVDPSQFDSMVMEYSDDPSKGANTGRFPHMKRGQMVKPFEDMSYSMENLGEISEPVETAYGYHLIRLNRKITSKPIPFGEVKADIMAQVREKHLEENRARYLRSLLDHEIELKEGAVEAMARRHFGDELELAPVYEE
jgi:parvulin-like peptidyl-prolyl isomerase